MQQCNICSSNPKNKIYNYQMFEPGEYVKSIRPSTGFIIEGLDTVTQTSAVTVSATNLNNSRAKHIECSLANQSLCDDLNKQYTDKVALVAELEPGYNEASKNFNTCNNHKNKCTGIMTAIDNIQKNINDFNSKIEDKRKILSTCELNKAECDKKKQEIQNKVMQIENLKIQINDNKKLYEINKCGT